MYPCLDLGLYMSYLCDLFFLFIFIFILINRANTGTVVLLIFFFQNISCFFWMTRWMKNVNSFLVAKVKP